MEITSDGSAPGGSDSPEMFCAAFAAALTERQVSLRRAEQLSGWGKTTIADARRGPALPNIDLVVDVLAAVGVETDELERWRRRHGALLEGRRSAPAPTGTLPAATSAGPDGPAGDIGPSPRTPRSRWLPWVLVGVLGVAVGVGAVLLAVREQPRDATGDRVVVVQNKVAYGPSALVEDRSPSYLSARPVARCANQVGCKLPGTDVSSGAALTAECQLQGELITNADVRSDGVRSNPNATASTLWYGIRWPDGRTGYLSEVYVTPPYRARLGLPSC